MFVFFAEVTARVDQWCQESETRSLLQSVIRQKTAIMHEKKEDKEGVYTLHLSWYFTVQCSFTGSDSCIKTGMERDGLEL